MNPKHPLSTITVYRLVASFILAISIYSCANMSRPGGGPRDETPPVFIKSMPVPNALNVSKQKIEIEFDEIIQVDKPSEKVIVSPPQKDMPEIRTSGRKITVILKDSLLPNTTYTIDFSDAIIDNNERNPLYGFAYSFSTGPKIDSLQVSGILLNARDLEPITGMLVGLHSDLEDSAFQKLPLERIASSDELGHFTIRNVTPGKYRLFALKDMNRDYRFDNPSILSLFLRPMLNYTSTPFGKTASPSTPLSNTTTPISIRTIFCSRHSTKDSNLNISIKTKEKTVVKSTFISKPPLIRCPS